MVFGNFDTAKQTFERYFNVVAIGSYDVVTSNNVKSTLQQRYVCQRLNL